MAARAPDPRLRDVGVTGFTTKSTKDTKDGLRGLSLDIIERMLGMPHPLPAPFFVAFGKRLRVSLERGAVEGAGKS